MSVFVLFVGIFSGFFSGLLGLGGGLIMTPMFLYGPSMAGVGALTVKEITGLTMVQGFAGAVSGLARHRGYGMVSWRLVRYAGIAAGISALAGAVISKWVADGAILAIFGAMALIASALIFLPGSRTAQDESEPGPFSFNAPLAVILGGAIGFAGGLVGQAGSFIMIPSMLYVLRVPTRIAIASNLGIILFSAVGGIAGKLTTAQVPLAPLSGVSGQPNGRRFLQRSSRRIASSFESDPLRNRYGSRARRRASIASAMAATSAHFAQLMWSMLPTPSRLGPV